MGEPIRVLHILQRMEAGGTQALLMNIYRKIDRTKVQFDFLVVYKEKQFYDDEIEKMGGHVYKLSFREDLNLPKFQKDLAVFFAQHHEYKIVHATLASTEVKKAVRKSAKTVKEQIQSGAPSRTGRYKESWVATKQSESSQSLQMVVHSKNRYQLAHLLEKGHAKRGGGRVAGRPHIAPAEQAGIEQLQSLIEKALK